MLHIGSSSLGTHVVGFVKDRYLTCTIAYDLLF
jgi:hypothetical protein